MANIAQYLSNILSSIYGEDIRQSIHDGISAINAEVESNRAAEAGRVSAESARVTAEASRVTVESARVTAETSRVTVENSRVTAETARNTAETARASAEILRANNESVRNTAETARNSAETARTSTFNTAIQNANTATTRANNAAELVEDIANGTEIPGILTDISGMKSEYTVHRDTKLSSSGTFVNYPYAENSKVEINKISGASTQIQSTQGKNIIPTNFSEWESGYYETSTGLKLDSSYRVRVKRLIQCTPSTTYYVNLGTSSSYKTVIVAYDQNGSYIGYIGTLLDDSTFTTASTVYFISIAILKAGDETGQSYSGFQTALTNGTIKPFVCLNSESSKLYEAFIPNMPSPDYPSVITSASNFKVKSCGKNLIPRAKNILTANGGTFTPQSDGGILINGTFTAQTDYYFNGSWTSTSTLFILKAGIYTLSKTGNQYASMYFGKTSLVYGSVASTTDQTRTFTEDSPVTFTLLRITSGAVMNNVLIYPQLELGSVATSYEPYTDDNQIVLPVTSTTYGGVSITMDPVLETITLNGTCNSTGTYLIPQNSFIFSGKYTFSLIPISGSISNGSLSAILSLWDSINANYVDKFSISDQNRNDTREYTASYASGNRIKLNFVSGTVFSNYVIHLRLRHGTDTSNSLSFISYPYEMSSVPSGVADTIELQSDGSVKKIQRIGKIILDGSSDETWTVRNAGDGITTISFSIVMNASSLSTSKLFSTIFKQDYSSSNGSEGFGYSGNDKSLFVETLRQRLVSYGYSTSLTDVQKVAVFRAWLAANPITVIYELATPIETVVDFNPYLISYDGITNVVATSSVPVTMSLNFKSSLWYMDKFKMDKLPLTNNFAVKARGTTIADGAALKILNDKIDSSTLSNQIKTYNDPESFPNMQIYTDPYHIAHIVRNMPNNSIFISEIGSNGVYFTQNTSLPIASTQSGLLTIFKSGNSVLIQITRTGLTSVNETYYANFNNAVGSVVSWQLISGDAIAQINASLSNIGTPYGTALSDGTYTGGTEYTVATLLIPAGTYIISCNTNAKDTEITSLMLKLGSTLLGRVRNANGTFFFSTGTQVTISMNVVYTSTVSLSGISQTYAWFKAVRLK